MKRTRKCARKPRVPNLTEILGRLLSLMRKLDRHLCRHDEGLSVEDQEALDALSKRSSEQLARLQALDAQTSQ